MTKRPNQRTIRAAQTYTIEEAAQALAVSIGTVRNWANAGLPMMKGQRPYLILGEALKDFLAGRAKGRRAELSPDQLYCLACKAPRKPLGMMVDCRPQTAKTARLSGLCDICGGTCNRMISTAKVEDFSRIFDLEIRGM
jgi:transposase